MSLADKESGYQVSGPQPGVRALAVAGLLFLLAGCTGVYRIHVDPDVLDRTQFGWTVTEHPPASSGLFGSASVETEYLYRSPDGNPPYSGLLQVFSLRGDPRSTQELLAMAQGALANASAAQSIVISESTRDDGTRRLAGGLATEYVIYEGKVTASGFPFPRDAFVRLAAEVGHDGRSGTSLVAVAIAQVGSATQCPVLGPCQATTDTRSWAEIVGDPQGAVDSMTSNTGLLYHLVTHG